MTHLQHWHKSEVSIASKGNENRSQFTIDGLANEAFVKFNQMLRFAHNSDGFPNAENMIPKHCAANLLSP
jgi:hypothetical protein